MPSYSLDTRTIVTVLLVVTVLSGTLYLLNPSYALRLLGKEGFSNGNGVLNEGANYKSVNAGMNNSGSTQMNANSMNSHVATPTAPRTSEGYANLNDMEGPSDFGSSEAPSGCYPRDQLTPAELLPKDPNSVWAQQNPMGTGSLKGKNFLSAGALIGVNTVGQSLRNANYQFRSEPPNPQVAVSVFNQTTIEPDVNRRNLEIA